MFAKVPVCQLRALCFIPWEAGAEAAGAATALGATLRCWFFGQQSHLYWATDATHVSKVTGALQMLTLVGCTPVNQWLGHQKGTDDVFQKTPTIQPK